jgi:hypothetical protein
MIRHILSIATTWSRFLCALGWKRTHEVGERALSEQFLFGRYGIGSAIADERRLELLAGGRPLFPQELRDPGSCASPLLRHQILSLHPDRRTSKNASEQAMSTIVADARSRCSGS